MADVFLSYGRSTVTQAGSIAAAVEQDGRSLWWDRRLAAGADYGSVIEREIAAAGCVLVAWSAAARDSLWVRAEANEALDQNKLIQLNLDGAKPPLPFNMLHFANLRGWNGARDGAPWPDVRGQVDAALAGAAAAPDTRRPDPGGVPMHEGREPALQGFGTVAALGWIALGTAIVLALAVLMVTRGLISAEAFGWLSIVAAVVAAVLLAVTALVLIRVTAASRR